jgi:hypothetical protein
MNLSVAELEQAFGFAIGDPVIRDAGCGANCFLSGIGQYLDQCFSGTDLDEEARHLLPKIQMAREMIANGTMGLYKTNADERAARWVLDNHRQLLLEAREVIAHAALLQRQRGNTGDANSLEYRCGLIDEFNRIFHERRSTT